MVRAILVPTMAFLGVAISLPCFSGEFEIDQLLENQCVQTAIHRSKNTNSEVNLRLKCFDYAMARAGIQRKLMATSDDDLMRVVGLHNTLYIEKSSSGQDKKVSMISGDMSQLGEVLAVSITPDRSTIAVLNQDQDENSQDRVSLLFFNSRKNGNVAPVRINRDKSLISANSVNFDSTGTRVFLTLATTSEVVSFDIQKDSRSPLSSKQPQKVIELNSEIVQSNHLLSAISLGDQFVTLDEQQGLKGYSSISGQIEQKWAIDREQIELTDLSYARYNHLTKSIHIFDSQGHSVVFNN